MRMRELREQLRRVDELRMPDVWSEARRRVVSGGLREVPLRDGPSSARRGAAAVVAFVVFAAGGTLLWRAIQPAPELRGPSPSPEPATDALSELAPGWTRLAPPPDYRCCAATAWTGSELLVWSGYEYTGFSDEVADPGGFRFDPISGRTRAMAPSPLDPRSVPASAWTGDELLVWGGQDPGGPPFYDDGAAYDPATDTWRLLPPSPLSARVPLSVWTGSQWILWGTGVRRDDRPLDGAAYDPASNTWRSIASGPIELTDATATWTGTEMIVFGAALHGGNQPESPTAIAAAYDPRADSWRTLRPSPLDTNSNTAVWNGSELVALDYDHASAAYDPQTDTWRDLGRVPGDDCEGGLSGSVAIDGDVLAIDCGEALLFEKGSDRWVDVTPADGIFGFAFLPFATTQPMSTALAFGIGDDFDPSGLFAYRSGGGQSSSACAEITEQTRFRDTALGQWLSTVLTGVGAPGGHGLDRTDLVEEHFAYTLDVPAYRGRFEVNMSAEEPDPENVDLSFLPVLAKSEGFTLRGTFTGEDGFQQFVIIGDGVWLSVHVIPSPDQIETPVMVEWFERVADRARTESAPLCKA
jgi:hypothetical protein